MARPRVFLSSTFYDLKYARAELDKFVRDMGYEPVLNERGQIPYGTEQALEEYCYAEVEKIHILVSIIGGRFGSQSGHSAQSVSNLELETAIKQKKASLYFCRSGSDIRISDLFEE